MQGVGKLGAVARQQKQLNEKKAAHSSCVTSHHHIGTHHIGTRHIGTTAAEICGRRLAGWQSRAFGRKLQFLKLTLKNSSKM
jgi:hypothetical protein